MVRTIQDIKDTMTTAFITDESIIESYGIDSSKTFEQQFSKLSLENLVFFICAAAIWTHEQMFTVFKSEIDTTVKLQKPHTLLWYRDLAERFRYGYDLLSDSDVYSEEAINDESASIVKFAAVKKVNKVLKMKVAKSDGTNLDKLSDQEMTAFVNYIEKTQDAGVNFDFVSREADQLMLTVDIYYNPLVLDGQGQRLDGNGDTTVQDAINDYLQNLTFDGEFSLTSLTDHLQRVEGVDDPRITGAERKWGDYDWEAIVNKYNPEAGWLKIYEEGDLTLIWHPTIQEN